MNVALASARFANGNVTFNLSQMERFAEMARNQGADLLCFGEAFLQGFDAFVWRYDADRKMAVSTDSPCFDRIRGLSRNTGVDLLFGFLERDGEKLYSSCALTVQGELRRLYRRVSRGWKEWTRADGHYREGTEVSPFLYKDKTCLIGLCGDLWDMPDRFALGADVLLWPVYIDYSPEEWQTSAMGEYAEQAAKCCSKTLMVNSLCDKKAFGGAFFFENGRVASALPMGQEGLLMVSI